MRKAKVGRVPGRHRDTVCVSLPATGETGHDSAARGSAFDFDGLSRVWRPDAIYARSRSRGRGLKAPNHEIDGLPAAKGIAPQLSGSSMAPTLKAPRTLQDQDALKLQTLPQRGLVDSSSRFILHRIWNLASRTVGYTPRRRSRGWRPRRCRVAGLIALIDKGEASEDARPSSRRSNAMRNRTVATADVSSRNGNARLAFPDSGSRAGSTLESSLRPMISRIHRREQCPFIHERLLGS